MKTHRCRHSFIEVLDHRIAPAGFIVAAGAGLVAIYANADADLANTYETLTDQFAPFFNYKGPITVAMGDFDGDTNDELVVAKAKGLKAVVKVYDLTGGGLVGPVLDKFVPFSETNNRGVSVAAGDLNGDGRDELFVGGGPGAAATVLVYTDNDSDGTISDIWPDMLTVFPPAFKGGVKVASGNVNNVLGEELVVGMWTKGGTVAIFADTNVNGQISDDNGGVAIETFKPFGPAFLGGVNVAAGPIENAGGNGAEVIVGTGVGKPKVLIYTDSNNNGSVADNPLFDTLLPAGKGLKTGAAVAAGDSDNSSFFVEVMVGPAAGAGAHVKVFDDAPAPENGSLLSDNPPSYEFDAFAKLNGGLHLAFGKVRTAFFGFNAFPQTIADDATLTTSIFIAPGAGRITDLDVSLSLFHDFDADLDVTLTHVSSGTSVTLFTDVGSGDNGFLIRLNDEAGTDMGAAPDDANDDPVTGNFNPEGAALFSAFDGLDLSGEWQLTIVDDAVGLSGTLFSWGLHATL